jgi:hypothetical protein
MVRLPAEIDDFDREHGGGRVTKGCKLSPSTDPGAASPMAPRTLAPTLTRRLDPGSTQSLERGGLMMRAIATMASVLGLALGTVACDLAEAPPRGVSRSPEPAMIMVNLEHLEGLRGFNLRAWVLPLEQRKPQGFLGMTTADLDRRSFSDVMHPESEYYYWEMAASEIATFEPGTYRLIVEVGGGWGLRRGCQALIRVTDDKTLVVTIPRIPRYVGRGVFDGKPAEPPQHPPCPK